MTQISLTHTTVWREPGIDLRTLFKAFRIRLSRAVRFAGLLVKDIAGGIGTVQHTIGTTYGAALNPFAGSGREGRGRPENW